MRQRTQGYEGVGPFGHLNGIAHEAVLRQAIVLARDVHEALGVGRARRRLLTELAGDAALEAVGTAATVSQCVSCRGGPAAGGTHQCGRFSSHRTCLALQVWQL